MVLQQSTDHQIDQSGISSFVLHAFRRSFYKIALVLLFLAILAAIIIFTSGRTTAGKTSAALQVPKTSNSTHLTVTQSTTPSSQPSTSASTTTTKPSASSSVSVNSSGNSSSTTQVTVDGQNVTVPENGTVQKTITSPDGSTSVSITSNSQSGGSNNSNTSTNLSVSTNSSSVNSSFSEDGMPPAY